MEPASKLWGIDQSIKYGDTTILSKTAGIVDSGTTFLYLPTDAYNQYVNATGAVHDENFNLLRINLSQYSNLKSLYFNIGGVSLV